ncbi:threonine aldolase family protein [Treponema socranskii]|uniref:threonine aldolase family protein n=1 Tax=Treponema socranskii TaxID=53419 RepID=UPI003D8B28EC
MQTENKPNFASDYLEGAHPAILQRLAETNTEQTSGYGTDEHCERARNLIRTAADCPNAAVHFFVGGTQTNATVIDAFLRPYEGVIAANTGHIAVHEAGAIEAGGHKVLTLAGEAGKLSAETLKRYLRDFYADENRAHAVQPGMVYISQPTECGTLYSKKELSDIAALCREYALAFYIDGARLAYALSSPKNDVTLSDLAAVSDAFYIGGTKCGALFGEALVIPDKNRLPCFVTTIKQHGALLAKGRLLGVQFETLFEDDLYFRIGEKAIQTADKIRSFLDAYGFRQYFASPTNQIFIVLKNENYALLSKKIGLSFWETADEAHTVARIATSWATTDEQVERLLKVLSEHSPCEKS